jgi:hypothetical protein
MKIEMWRDGVAAPAIYEPERIRFHPYSADDQEPTKTNEEEKGL